MSLRPTDTASLAAAVRTAHDARTPLRIVGRGSWLTAGGPVAPATERLELGAFNGITAYVPGDLTLTARANTTLAEVDAITAGHGQWCPLFPWGDDEAALGAVMATATVGPFARALGRPRDVALGLEFVDGTGAHVRAGGRVVKNVAGFDLTRLLVGSWGTLGVITEVTVRLRARPALDETYAIRVDPADSALREALAAFERGTMAPLAVASFPAAASVAAGLPRDTNTLVRIGGNASFVAAARRALAEIALMTPCDVALWQRVRRFAADDAPLDFSRALADPLSRRIREKFDPRGILNPGVLGGIRS